MKLNTDDRKSYHDYFADQARGEQQEVTVVDVADGAAAQLEELHAAMREQRDELAETQRLMRRLISRVEDEGSHTRIRVRKKSVKGSSTSSAGEGAAATIDAGDGAADVREEADLGI